MPDITSTLRSFFENLEFAAQTAITDLNAISDPTPPEPPPEPPLHVEPPPPVTSTWTKRLPIGAGGFATRGVCADDGWAVVGTDTSGAILINPETNEITEIWPRNNPDFLKGIAGDAGAYGATMNKADSNEIYVVGVAGVDGGDHTRARLFKSTDRGASFTDASGPILTVWPNHGNQRLYDGHVAVDPLSRRVIYGDGLRLWLYDPLDDTNTDITPPFPARGDWVGYAGMIWVDECAYVTDCAGQWGRWTDGVWELMPIDPNGVAPHSTAVDSEGFLWIGDANGLSCLDTMLGQWVTVPQANARTYPIAIHPTQDDFIIVGDGNDIPFRNMSLDGGVTWLGTWRRSDFPTMKFTSLDDVPWHEDGDGYRANAAITRPDGSIIWVGGNHGLAVTSFDAVEIAVLTPEPLHAGTIGAGYTNLITRIGVFTSRGFVLGALDELGGLVPYDGYPAPETWGRHIFTGRTDLPLQHVWVFSQDPNDIDVVAGASSYNEHWKVVGIQGVWSCVSYDGGLTFTPFPTQPVPVGHRGQNTVIIPNGPNIFFAVIGEDGGWKYTNDGGVSWTTIAFANLANTNIVPSTGSLSIQAVADPHYMGVFYFIVNSNFDDERGLWRCNAMSGVVERLFAGTPDGTGTHNWATNKYIVALKTGHLLMTSGYSGRVETEQNGIPLVRWNGAAMETIPNVGEAMAIGVSAGDRVLIAGWVDHVFGYWESMNITTPNVNDITWTFRGNTFDGHDSMPRGISGDVLNPGRYVVSTGNGSWVIQPD